ncbi:Uncharacterised protein [Vibrio cholerae]|nr:Uncharacterised protein [Vibrio cholerae]
MPLSKKVQTPRRGAVQPVDCLESETRDKCRFVDRAPHHQSSKQTAE